MGSKFQSSQPKFLEDLEKFIKSVKDKAVNHYQLIANLKDKIPNDPSNFYKDFGLLEHPLTGKPVDDLTYYQKEAWQDVERYRYILDIKSNKIGLSTSHLMCLFYHMITDCQGYQALIIAQNLRMAREHLYTLHKLILNSDKYRPYLISIGDKDVNLLREETSRVTEMFLRNPSNPHKPTRIIAIPLNAGSAVSWKEVKYIMASDITMTDHDYDPVVKGLFTRLANTQGYFVIETIPRGPKGLVYDTWLRNRTQGSTDFKVREYPVAVAVEAGLITDEFLQGERQRHGVDFDRLYNCSFAATEGNIFDLTEVEFCVSSADYNIEDPEFMYNRNYPKAMGVDPGYRTSKAGIVVAQMRNGVIEIILAKELQEAHSVLVNECFDTLHKYSIENMYVDAAAPAFITDVKNRMNETTYEVMKEMLHNPSNMERVVPVTFNPMNRAMLNHASQLVSDKFVKIKQHQSTEALLIQMRNARHVQGKLIKNEEGMTYDLLDALFLSLLHFGMQVEKTK
jgi:hypothetical protein